jgi:hypothetical protein
MLMFLTPKSDALHLPLPYALHLSLQYGQIQPYTLEQALIYFWPYIRKPTGSDTVVV